MNNHNNPKIKEETTIILNHNKVIMDIVKITIVIQITIIVIAKDNHNHNNLKNQENLMSMVVALKKSQRTIAIQKFQVGYKIVLDKNLFQKQIFFNIPCKKINHYAII